MPSRLLPVASALAALLLASCASSDGAPAVSTTASTPTTAAAPASGLPPTTTLTMPAEAPDARNDRLLRLETACDQWFAAGSRQEFAQQASLAGLVRTYVRNHFDLVVSDLRLGSPRHRKTMALALGFSDRPEAVPVLMESMKDQYFEVVLHSLLGLYLLAQPGATVDQPLHPKEAAPNVTTAAAVVAAIDVEMIAPYLRHPKPEVRSNAAMLLGRIVKPGASKSVLLVLVGATEDEDPVTRAQAVGALGGTGDHEVFPYLVKALRDKVQLVRVRAALGLGRLKDVEATPYLIGVLADPAEKFEVKRAAAKALNEVTGNTKVDSLDPVVWRAALAPAPDKG